MDEGYVSSHYKRQALAAGVIIVLSAGMSGCADFVISDADLKRITASVERAAALSPCTNARVPAAGNKTIDIEFTKNSSGAWCPTGQVESCPQVFQAAKVQWRSVRKNESGEWEALNTRFKVYFTPFQGTAFTAANGKTGLKNFDLEAPPGIYKYTVWDWPAGKNSHNCPPLDPTFRVN